MSFRKYLQRLCQWLRDGHRTRPIRRKVRLEVEVLEERVVPSVSAQFDWSMADRFGIDSNHNGRIDLPNNKFYANPGTFTVNFAAQNPQESCNYQWTVTPANAPLVRYSYSGPQATDGYTEGVYYVKLDVFNRVTGEATSETQSITVKDILIVSIGDSYASGEGNPEKGNTFVDTYLFGKYQDDDPLWADDGAPAGLVAGSDNAHRSTKAAPAQVALQLEKAD